MKNLFTNKKDLEAVEKQITDPSYKRLETKSKSKAIDKDSPFVCSHVFDHAMACLVAQSTEAPAKVSAPKGMSPNDTPFAVASTKAPAKASKPISAPITHKPIATIPKPPAGRTATQFLALPVADQNLLIRACCAQNAGAATRKEVRAAYEAADSKTRLAFYRVFKISLTSF